MDGLLETRIDTPVRGLPVRPEGAGLADRCIPAQGIGPPPFPNPFLIVLSLDLSLLKERSIYDEIFLTHLTAGYKLTY